MALFAFAMLVVPLLTLGAFGGAPARRVESTSALRAGDLDRSGLGQAASRSRIGPRLLGAVATTVPPPPPPAVVVAAAAPVRPVAKPAPRPAPKPAPKPAARPAPAPAPAPAP